MILLVWLIFIGLVPYASIQYPNFWRDAYYLQGFAWFIFCLLELYSVKVRFSRRKQ